SVRPPTLLYRRLDPVPTGLRDLRLLTEHERADRRPRCYRDWRRGDDGARRHDRRRYFLAEGARTVDGPDHERLRPGQHPWPAGRRIHHRQFRLALGLL